MRKVSCCPSVALFVSTDVVSIAYAVVTFCGFVSCASADTNRANSTAIGEKTERIGRRWLIIMTTKQKGGGLFRHPPYHFTQSLEREFHAKFRGERMRHNHARRSDEPLRLAKVGLPHVSEKVIAIVGAVRQVKHLQQRRNDVVFFELKVLADACVELEECLTTQVVKRRKRALASAEAAAIFHRIRSDTWIPERG